MNRGSSASISSTGQVTGALRISVWYQWSRPGCQPCSTSDSWPMRLTTITFSTEGQSTTASLTICFMRMMLPRRQPPSAVTTTLERLSLMRSRERLRGEAAEDDRVNGPDPRARQHGDGGLGDHGQVDGHPVALADAHLPEHVGEAADLPVQVQVGEHPLVAGLAFPDDGRLRPGVRLQVAVETVVSDVQLAPQKPLGERRVPLQHLVPPPEPVQPLRLGGPEALPVPRGLLVEALIRHVGPGGELGRRRETPVLVEKCRKLLGIHPDRTLPHTIR